MYVFYCYVHFLWTMFRKTGPENPEELRTFDPCLIPFISKSAKRV